MSDWFDDAVEYNQAIEAAEAKLERNNLKMYIVLKAVDILMTGILGGTFIAFWALFALGRIN